jgi:hypothetical protein
VISTKYRGAAVCAHVAKNDKKKRPAINIGKLNDKEVTIVARHTPKHPKNMCQVRPYQSAIQMNSAPAI